MTALQIVKAMTDPANIPLEEAVARRTDALTAMLDQVRTGAQQSGDVMEKLRAIALLDEISVAVAEHLDSGKGERP